MLNKHIFITGVTGAGKTTTCLNLLRESELPFLVIEPAKTEYRALNQQMHNVRYYRPNGDPHQSLRINPFALIHKDKSLKSHASFLKNVFTTVFPMEASMPMMVEAAILAAYEEKGWDLDQNEYLPDDNPFDPVSRAWPTMSDMVGQLDEIICSYGLGKEFEEKYRGSLVSRLRSLTDGPLGQVLNVPQSIDFKELLKSRSVLELELLQSGEDKALIMALLLGSINDAIRLKYQEDPSFRQLTLIEEAHRLLSRPEPGDKAAAMAVETFADMLAEVRKFGVGIVIADQIPAKLIPDVIKNTNTKIVHRLFAEDDRRAMGEAMMMDDEQRSFLPNLGIGEAIVFCGGWHGAAHCQITAPPKPDMDALQDPHITELGLAQLWRERARYFPNFCRLGWLTEDSADKAMFADFVGETRLAQNQMFYFAAHWQDQRPGKRTETAFNRIKRWHARWYETAAAAHDSPELLLAQGWAALLNDSTPLVRPEKAEKFTNLLEIPQAQLAKEAEQVFDLYRSSDSIEEMNNNILPVRNDIAKQHLKYLQNYKSL